MNNLSDISTIKTILGRYGFQFQKSLGQNFLIDDSVCPRMAQLSGAGKDTGIIEIGPGIGVLSKELSLLAEKVVAIELDKRLLPVLSETLSDCENFEVINGDILKIDLNRLITEKFSGLKVLICANLPYYITSPVIMKILEERLPIQSLTVMVQKEAAERICAKPGTRACGAVSASVSYYSQPEILFQVPRDSFFPAPNVDSAVIRLTIRETPPVNITDEKQFFRLIRAAFGQRRKTALNAISAGLSMEKNTVSKAMEEAGIPLNFRAEQFTLENFAALSCILF